MTGFVQPAVRLLVSSYGTSVWPLVVVPALVYELSRPILSMIDRMALGSLWPERLAFCAAVTPGLAFMGLAPFTLKGFDFQMALHSWTCFIHCYGLAFIFLAAPGRAAAVYYRRHRQISQLLALAENPSSRLAALQSELQIPVRELPTKEPACFLVGIFHAVVCVSRGALASLSDDQLRAALLHERAHWRRRETLRASIAMLLNECTVLPVRSALDQYRRCVEFIADHETLKDAHPVTLASALLAFARFPLNAPPAVNLAGQNVKDRVSLLLGVAPRKSEVFLDKPFAVALLAAEVSLAFLPYLIHAVARLLCATGG
jgi:hypothetical protein